MIAMCNVVHFNFFSHLILVLIPIFGSGFCQSEDNVFLSQNSFVTQFVTQSQFLYSNSPYPSREFDILSWGLHPLLDPFSSFRASHVLPFPQYPKTHCLPHHFSIPSHTYTLSIFLFSHSTFACSHSPCPQVRTFFLLKCLTRLAAVYPFRGIEIPFPFPDHQSVE